MSNLPDDPPRVNPGGTSKVRAGRSLTPDEPSAQFITFAELQRRTNKLIAEYAFAQGGYHHDFQGQRVLLIDVARERVEMYHLERRGGL